MWFRVTHLPRHPSDPLVHSSSLVADMTKWAALDATNTYFAIFLALPIFSYLFYFLRFHFLQFLGSPVVRAPSFPSALQKAQFPSFHSVQSLSRAGSLQPGGLQHARLPCTSLTPGACSNSYASSW